MFKNEEFARLQRNFYLVEGKNNDEKAEWI